jgi:hypothetical protein
MMESLAFPQTPTEPNRYFREASNRLKNPPTWLEDMKTWVNSSLYLKSIRQMENPSESNLVLVFTFTMNAKDVLLVEPLQGILGVQVGVLPLPLLKVEGGFR